MMEEMKRVRVMGVAMPSELEAPVVILEDDQGAAEFCVSVGAAEAGAILMELEGVSTPRPLTHELMAQVFHEQGLSLRRVELYGGRGMDEDGFIARLHYGKGLRSWTRDVRPSDALALAVTTGAPIYAHQSAFDQPAADMALSAAVTDGYWFMNQKRA